MDNTTHRRMAFGVRGGWWLAHAALSVVAACTIAPLENVYKCSDDNTDCPPGQICDRVDHVCRVMPLVPDASMEEICPGGCSGKTPFCVKGVCVECSPSCEGNAPVTCSEGGEQQRQDACTGDTPLCVRGTCVECASGEASCDGDTPVVCSADGKKQRQDACSGARPNCVNGVCEECVAGTRSCDGNTPVVCSADGSEQRAEACGGDKPICNNGVCGTLRLRGGLGGAGPLLPSTDGVRLVEHRLTQAGERQCADIKGQRVCLHGGIEP